MLAAGRGERLRPFTDDVAKPALDVKGAPLGAYALRLFRDLHGRIAVNLSWLWRDAQAILRPYAPSETLWIIERPEPVGTARTIAGLLSQLASTFVVVNGDTVTDLNLDDLLATHARLGAAATLAVQEVTHGADLELEGAFAARLIDRRREPDAEGARYIGVAVFERDRVARYLTGATAPGLAEAVFAPLTGQDLVVHVHDGAALDVGTPERLREARGLDWLTPPTRRG